MCIFQVFHEYEKIFKRWHTFGYTCRATGCIDSEHIRFGTQYSKNIQFLETIFSEIFDCSYTFYQLPISENAIFGFGYSLLPPKLSVSCAFRKNYSTNRWVYCAVRLYCIYFSDVIFQRITKLHGYNNLGRRDTLNQASYMKSSQALRFFFFFIECRYLYSRRCTIIFSPLRI